MTACTCVTCSDEGTPFRIRALDADADGLADCVGDDGANAEVDVALVAPVAVGDRVLVHAGVAIARLGYERPDAESRHQDVGLDAPRG
jgi:hydrogenase maturation factor